MLLQTMPGVIPEQRYKKILITAGYGSPEDQTTIIPANEMMINYTAKRLLC